MSGVQILFIIFQFFALPSLFLTLGDSFNLWLGGTLFLGIFVLDSGIARLEHKIKDLQKKEELEQLEK